MLTLQESKSSHFNKQKLLNNVRHELQKKKLMTLFVL